MVETIGRGRQGRAVRYLAFSFLAWLWLKGLCKIHTCDIDICPLPSDSKPSGACGASWELMELSLASMTALVCKDTMGWLTCLHGSRVRSGCRVSSSHSQRTNLYCGVDEPEFGTDNRTGLVWRSTTYLHQSIIKHKCRVSASQRLTCAFHEAELLPEM